MQPITFHPNQTSDQAREQHGHWMEVRRHVDCCEITLICQRRNRTSRGRVLPTSSPLAIFFCCTKSIASRGFEGADCGPSAEGRL